MISHIALALSLSMAVPIKAGDPAPYDGMLLTTEESLNIIRKDKEHEAAKADAVNQANERCQTSKDYDQKLFELTMKEADETHAKELEMVSPSWYERPIIVVPATIVAVAVVVIGFAKLASAIK